MEVWATAGLAGLFPKPAEVPRRERRTVPGGEQLGVGGRADEAGEVGLRSLAGGCGGRTIGGCRPRFWASPRSERGRTAWTKLARHGWCRAPSRRLVSGGRGPLSGEAGTRPGGVGPISSVRGRRRRLWPVRRAGCSAAAAGDTGCSFWASIVAVGARVAVAEATGVPGPPAAGGRKALTPAARFWAGLAVSAAKAGTSRRRVTKPAPARASTATITHKEHTGRRVAGAQMGHERSADGLEAKGGGLVPSTARGW